MVHPSTQKLTRLAAWWARTRDMPVRPRGAFEQQELRRWARTRDTSETLVLYGWLGFALSLGVYSAREVYFNDEAGSYVNVNLRGDPMKQAEPARNTGLTSAAEGKHSVFWHVAQIKVDKDGANVGIFDNRTRPHQYSKPGFAGTGAGMPAN